MKLPRPISTHRAGLSLKLPWCQAVGRQSLACTQQVLMSTESMKAKPALPGKLSGPHCAPPEERPLSDVSFPPLTGNMGRRWALPWGTSAAAACTGPVPNWAEDNTLGFRKLPLNRFSHDIILPGCGTVRAEVGL